jgi:hypothetical protein
MYRLTMSRFKCNRVKERGPGRGQATDGAIVVPTEDERLKATTTSIG